MATGRDLAWNGSSPGRTIKSLVAFDKEWTAEHPDAEKPYAIVLLHSGLVKTGYATGAVIF